MEKQSEILMLNRYLKMCEEGSSCKEVINFIFDSIKTLYNSYIVLDKFKKNK